LDRSLASRIIIGNHVAVIVEKVIVEQTAKIIHVAKVPATEVSLGESTCSFKSHTYWIESTLLLLLLLFISVFSSLVFELSVANNECQIKENVLSYYVRYRSALQMPKVD
jgi:hypothetical protein